MKKAFWSAGAHLSALVALAGDEPFYSSEYRSDPNAPVSSRVKAVVGFYGVYDMLAQWQHDLVARPRDNIAEKFLGAAPYTNRQVFFEASPISYATVSRNSTRFLLIHGTDDDIVDPPYCVSWPTCFEEVPRPHCRLASQMSASVACTVK